MTLQELAHELPALRDEAKALWDKPINGHPNVFRVYDLNGEDIEEWLFKLIEMIKSDKPQKYLKENTK